MRNLNNFKSLDIKEMKEINGGSEFSEAVVKAIGWFVGSLTIRIPRDYPESYTVAL